MGDNAYFIAIDGLLKYYHFIFNIFGILTFIVLINCVKAGVAYRQIKKRQEDVKINGSDLLVSLLCGFALFNGLLFQGVIADVSAYHSDIWFNRVLALCISAFLLYILQIFFTVRSGHYSQEP